jgi:hypothetical protein
MRQHFFSSIALGLCFLMSAPLAFAATIYVNSSTGNDSTGTGASTTPYATFTKAYSMSSAGDTINLTGTFDWSNPNETGSALATGFTIGKNLTIQGQSATTTIVQASSTPNTANRSVFTVSPSVTVTFANITIQNGRATTTNSGAGITNNGTAILDSDIVTNNYANMGAVNFAAGAIFSASGSALTIATSTVSNNTFNGEYYGSGGLFLPFGSTSLTITASTFSGNSATSLAPSTFPYSYAEPSGAISILGTGGTYKITNSTFSGNSTNAYAGAINAYATQTTTITNTTIANNTATQGGGGIVWESSSSGFKLYLMDNILYNNMGNSTQDDFHGVDATSTLYVIDNGYNIVGSSTNKVWSATGDLTGTQSSLNLSNTLATNGATNGVQTLALSAGSVAINSANTVAGSSLNNGVHPPSVDERGFFRPTTLDMGAFQYETPVTLSTITPVPSQLPATSTSVIFSFSISNPDNRIGNYVLSPCGTSTTFVSATTSQVIFSGLQAGQTYSCSLGFTTSDDLTSSNQLAIGPFTVNALVVTTSTPPATITTTTTSGVSGQSTSPAILARIKAFEEGISTNTPAPTSSGGSSGSFKWSFTSNLQKGMSGAAVASLQKFLMSMNLGSASQALTASGATGYFGTLTKTALIAYQKANGITPASGYFGPITRSRVNQ